MYLPTSFGSSVRDVEDPQPESVRADVQALALDDDVPARGSVVAAYAADVVRERERDRDVPGDLVRGVRELRVRGLCDTGGSQRAAADERCGDEREASSVDPPPFAERRTSPIGYCRKSHDRAQNLD
jgi:hypothetical protein